MLFSLDVKFMIQKNEYYKLIQKPQKDFEEEYINLGGIPEEVLADIDFKNYVFEIIKEDLRLLSQYKPKSKKNNGKRHYSKWHQ